ncbi:anaphase-promoting complex subunit 13 [Odontomachus brunneus]|uniref:anaphase-promoting complex subunit 13 n=1 Tax=Odontomachus brunneus TaxID=486640 RepID=UPI0013F27382|nr:anaphase-promoting complex subunit 13 [Odontomachus brunneus]
MYSLCHVYCRFSILTVISERSLYLHHELTVIYERDMDSQVCGDGRLIDLIDEGWRKEKLPIDDISTPVAELPDPESDNGDSHMTLKELEQRWNNLALSTLSDNHLHSPTPLHN